MSNAAKFIERIKYDKNYKAILNLIFCSKVNAALGRISVAFNHLDSMRQLFGSIKQVSEIYTCFYRNIGMSETNYIHGRNRLYTCEKYMHVFSEVYDN